MSMTYDSLVSQIMSYLNRTDAETLAQVPNFISQAESRISREAKSLIQEVVTQGLLEVGVSVYQKSARWRRTVSVSIGQGPGNNSSTRLELRSYEYCRAVWPDATQLAPPKYYCDYAYNNYLLVPTPDQAYPVEVVYLQYIDPLTAMNQQNFLTLFAPDLMLYATLLETSPFLKDDERTGMWQDRYDKALASLNTQDEQRVFDRSGNRMSD